MLMFGVLASCGGLGLKLVEVGKGRRVEEHKKHDGHAETGIFVMFGQTDRSQTPLWVSVMCLNGRRAGGGDEKWGKR